MVLFQSGYVTLRLVLLTETNSFCLAGANKAKEEPPDSLAVFIRTDSQIVISLPQNDKQRRNRPDNPVFDHI